MMIVGGPCYLKTRRLFLLNGMAGYGALCFGFCHIVFSGSGPVRLAIISLSFSFFGRCMPACATDSLSAAAGENGLNLSNLMDKRATHSGIRQNYSRIDLDDAFAAWCELAAALTPVPDLARFNIGKPKRMTRSK